MTRPVVVDTNIIFSALLRRSTHFAEVLLGSGREFLISESVLVELFRRRDKIVRLSKLSEEDVVQLYSILLRRLAVHRESLIPLDRWREAHQLCKGVDETDTPHVALTLTVNGLLWSGDKLLKEELSRQGFHNFFVPHTEELL